MPDLKAPLAYRMRPEHLDEYVGQKHLVAPGKPLRRMIEKDQLQSMILFGPPGTGKSSIAQVIAEQCQAHFVRLNAVSAGVSDIKKIVEEAKSPLMRRQRTVVFIDEIHRFNKAQQDALLPYVEDGTLILIGATTENPYFEVNKALISRANVFKLEPLENEELYQLLERALTSEKGLGHLNIDADPEALEWIVRRSNGDARLALTSLELAVLMSDPDEKGRMRLDLSSIQKSLQERSIPYDAKGEEHYDIVSALIKSMRGSDPDAALYWLAKALYGGEDPEFLARRIVICASEDVGMANPQALILAVSAWQAVHAVGMPEARIILAQACVTVAVSPKSNSSYKAMDLALKTVKEGQAVQVPLHLRNAPIEDMATKLGYSLGYKYPHDFPGHIVKQDYLPDALKDQIFYEPGDLGAEAKVEAWLRQKRARKYKKDSEHDPE